MISSRSSARTAPASRSLNIYTFRKCIKRARKVRDQLGFQGLSFLPFHSPCVFSSFSPPSLADIVDASSFRQLLLQVARSSSLDRIPSASCKVVRRSRARWVHRARVAVRRDTQRLAQPTQETPFPSSSNGLIKQWHAGIRR